MDSQLVPKEWLTAPTTLQEIMATCNNEDPQVAAVANHYLNQAAPLFQQMQPGDELWNYSSPSDDWANNRGNAGLAIVRDGELIDSMCMVRN
ncbi:hypothetical protein Pan97_37280 [Bremerella volcania]|uniref:Uncharacterized protein n=1 Tax=Bremerella volcania TaxID=2527984 RepID=A0A518CBT0_9BACT|nr:hypothetical protein [Bremerella volcania]QDU76673.1 hypothetical protein Pan97_37280 [Bremerella volcania]